MMNYGGGGVIHGMMLNDVHGCWKMVFEILEVQWEDHTVEFGPLLVLERRALLMSGDHPKMAEVQVLEL